MSEIFQDAVPVNYYPADLPINEVHETKSHSLVKRVVAEQPDLIIFKGIDYDLVQFVIDQIDLEITKIGFIIGGASSGIILNYASFVVTESERQSEVVRGQVHPQVPVKVLAKYINWGVIDKFDGALKPRKYDIVNVGYFEPRKNQIGLRPFFDKYRIAIVGHGPTHGEVRSAAEGHHNVEFLGDLPNDVTLGVIANSRLMVHTSKWEGLPRAIIESLSCGTPVVAFDSAIQADLSATRSVNLVNDDTLIPTVGRLLHSDGELAVLSAEAVTFARSEHGPARLKEFADFIRGWGNH
jgi:glycosyltransferase involved in cell wall biosynthesis